MNSTPLERQHSYIEQLGTEFIIIIGGIMAIFSPYFSEIEEFCSFLIKGYMETTTKTDSTDIDDFVSRELGYKVTYESFADSDSDALGFTSDGSTAIYVNRDGERQLVLFPAKRIILDKVLLRKEYEHKRRFVLAHEAGHIIAQKKMVLLLNVLIVTMEMLLARQELSFVNVCQ